MLNQNPGTTTNKITLDYFYNITITSYTHSDIRKMVDDMDNTIRASVVKGDVESVFVRERGNIVSNTYPLLLNDSKTYLG